MSDVQTSYDLQCRLPEVRDQGPRPTCLAFAVSDAHSAHRSTAEPFSVEYLFYHSVQLSHKDPRLGATVAHTRATLQARGQPVESDWPYAMVAPESLLGAWNDPTTTQSCYKRLSSETSADWGQIVGSLKDGKPVVAIVDLSPSFYFPVEGIIDIAANERATGIGRHAVLIVGAGKVDGQDALLIRNSWGPGWGIEGYAWMTWADASSFLLSMVLLGDDPDVLANTAAA